uniref:Leucine-rich repeat-containing protein n=1 Tax=Panagrolaimus davidi TaxID=227884 RepID=A0A914P2P7_9BILA
MTDNSENLKKEALEIMEKSAMEITSAKAMNILKEKIMDKTKMEIGVLKTATKKKNADTKNGKPAKEPKMEMGGTEKVLKQKMTDIKDAIAFFCDQENFGQIPEDSRFIMNSTHTRFVEIETQKEYHWRKPKPKDTWNFLIFDHSLLLFIALTLKKNNCILVIMTRFENVWFDAINLTMLIIIDCEINDTSDTAWKLFASGIAKLQKLEKLRISANLTDIPDIVFQKLPTSITYLDLSKNQFETLSTEISNLSNLQTLILNENPMLTYIPWKFLPKPIKWLLLENTGITIIPEDIQVLINLCQLDLKHTCLERIAWNSLTNKIHSVTLQTVKNLKEIIYAIKIKTLKIYDTDLKGFGIESTLSNLPNLIDLTLNNTNLDKFDCTNLWFNSLDLSHNNLTEFSWESVSHFRGNDAIPLSVNLSHNKLTVFGSPNHWKNLEFLNVSNNKIEEILMEEMDDVEDTHNNPKLSLNLSNNQLKFLPIGFEKFICISQLSVSGNFIKYENIEETLWKRLPQSLTVLNLNGLQICTLPCIPKNFTLLKEIYAADCNLHWICPQISKNENLQYLDISNNPSLKTLSFVPAKPYLYPQRDNYRQDIEFVEKADGVAEGIKVPPTDDFTIKPLKLLTSKHYGNNEEKEKSEFMFGKVSKSLIVNKKAKRKSNNGNKNFLNKENELQSFRCTDRAPVKNLNYNFDLLTELEPNCACQCCAKCGEKTDNQMIEQLMTMDIDLYQFNDSKNKEILEWNRDLWISKKWKTIVKTRLCEVCKEWFKNEAKKVVEIHKKKMENAKENLESVKRKRAENENRKKKIKIPGEEDSDDEESEIDENIDESEDSVLSEEESSDEEKEASNKAQSYGAPLTIGSTITLPWPPVIPEHEQQNVLPSINTIYRQPQNDNYYLDQSSKYDNSIYNANEQTYIEPPDTYYHQQNIPAEHFVQPPSGQHEIITSNTPQPYYINNFSPQHFYQQNQSFNPAFKPVPEQTNLTFIEMQNNYYHENAQSTTFQSTNMNNNYQNYSQPQQYYNEQQLAHPSQTNNLLYNSQHLNTNDHQFLLPSSEINDPKSSDELSYTRL